MLLYTKKVPDSTRTDMYTGYSHGRPIPKSAKKCNMWIYIYIYRKDPFPRFSLGPHATLIRHSLTSLIWRCSCNDWFNKLPNCYCNSLPSIFSCVSLNHIPENASEPKYWLPTSNTLGISNRRGLKQGFYGCQKISWLARSAGGAGVSPGVCAVVGFSPTSPPEMYFQYFCAFDIFHFFDIFQCFSSFCNFSYFLRYGNISIFSSYDNIFMLLIDFMF